MKIKMLTTASGPDLQYNFGEGDIRDVSVEEARYWLAAGVCTLLEPYPGDAEKAVLKAPEKAVTGPVEIAGKGKVTVADVKPPAEAPASPDAAKSAADAPEWGKVEVK